MYGLVGRNKRSVSGGRKAGNSLWPLRLGSPVPAALAQAGLAYPGLRRVVVMFRHHAFLLC
jgi:hypothetical protein